VPIVGYENEALAGLLRRVPAGVGVPMDDASSLADALARLHTQRESLATMSHHALEFAVEHTFEETVRKRMEHLQTLVADAERKVTSSLRA
jgi:hypothetical protein